MRNKKAPSRFLDNLKIDFWLFLALCVTMTFGLFVLYSASNQSSAVIENQLMKILFGFVVMVVCAQANPQVLKIYTPVFYAGTLFLLMLVPLIGETTLGAKRWLDFGIRFQPSEFAKFTMPMMLAWYFSGSGAPTTLKRIVISFVIMLIPCALIVTQPDLGTSILVAAAGIFVIFLAGISWKFIGGAFFSLLAFLPVAWNFLLKDYQKVRVMTLLNPEADPTGSGYHVIQSKIAIGSGGFSGTGWLEGIQSHLNFIPEQRTDFIFAVLSEELGLFGFLILMACYFLIVARCFYIFFKLRETFDRLVCGALLMIFVCYIFVNIGMVSGILPVVGVPLPLISFGGTSIVSLLAGFGVISAFYHNQKMKSGKVFKSRR